ncbi:MAG: nitrite/sulfite reductase [Alphaproteobacteria bacterium]
MYRYDEFDHRFVAERVTQFREQVARRLANEIDEEAFKPLRLMNGLYLQLHAYMLRVAIPYGTLSSRQMRALADIADTYDKGYGHFTTRQNIQFNWIKLADAPDLLDDLAKVEMHAIQTSGNCIRNVTADQFAGAAADEIDDPRIVSEAIRQWSTLHPEFSFLPRKFKIAVTAAPFDRAAIKVHDIGLRLSENDDGERGFEVVVGGGLGRTPRIGHVVRDFLPERHLLSYLEAILRVYNQLGRRDNLYKARIKILLDESGIAEFSRLVEAEWAELKDTAVDLPADELARIAAYFAPPAFEVLGDDDGVDAAARSNPGFAQWLRANVVRHKVQGYAIANVSLKPAGGIPGDATSAQMRAVADLAERYSFGEIRVAHEQNLVLPHVRRADLFALWQALDAAGMGDGNLGLIGDIIACPGLDYCGLATARSIPVAQAISERFASPARQHEIGPLSLNISGCINACGHHHVGNIGILGVEKRGEEFYQITLGGRADEAAALGELIGPALPADEVADAIEAVVETYLALRQPHEPFVETYARVGIDPFKERLYGQAAA